MSYQLQNLDVALRWAASGFAVIPCRPTKAPYIVNWPSNGTTNETLICAWWQQFPDAIPGIPTGINNLLIIDCDRKNGLDGVAAWNELCARNAFDQSACFAIETPSGGRHVWFRQHKQPLLRNTVGKLAPGIDTRGDGGQVIAPGAVLPDGRTYVVRCGAASEITLLPEGLRDWIDSLETPRAGEVLNALSTSGTGASIGDREQSYAQVVLIGEVKKVSEATPGSRNATLNKAAFLIGTIIPNGGITRATAEHALFEAALNAGLEPGEIVATIKSGIDSGLLQRRPSVAELSASKAVSTLSSFTPPIQIQNGDQAVVKCVADVNAEAIKWLWRSRVSIGKLTLVAGDPGLGKSQLAAFIAARVTTRTRWPNDDGIAPIGSVVMLSCEDDIADTIRPRLEAAEANIDRVHVIEAVRSSVGRVRGFSLQDDLAHLESTLDRIGDAKLVIVDPITAYLGKTDSHKTADVRGILAPLQELAARRGVAVVAISHLNKNSGGGKSINAVTGSNAFVAASRGAFLVVRDNDDPSVRLLVETKNNLASAPTLAFVVHSKMLPNGIVAPFIQFRAGTVAMTADEAIADGSRGEDGSALNEAKDFLKAELANGPQSARAIIASARQAGVSEKTLRRAAKQIGVLRHKEGFQGEWAWSFPAAALLTSKVPIADKDAHQSEKGIFEASWPSLDNVSGTDER